MDWDWTDHSPPLQQSPLLLGWAPWNSKIHAPRKTRASAGNRFRHYNASTLNFDDLVGFPVPDGDQVRYLRTPLDAWNAEAILSMRSHDVESTCKFVTILYTNANFKDNNKLTHRKLNPPPTGEEDENHQYWCRTSTCFCRSLSLDNPYQPT